MLERYLQRKGHYPRARVKAGVQTITLEVAPGYITIRTTGGGQASQCVYIPRSAWLKLLRWCIKPTKLMTHDFDPVAARLQYAEKEQEHLDELRRQKRDRKRGRKAGRTRS